MQQAIDGANVQACPEWCAGCTPEDEGGFGHFGELRNVGLSLMAPSLERGFVTPGLQACVVKYHEDALPVISLSTGEGRDEEFKLTIGEALDLAKILQGLTGELAEADE